MVRNAGGKASGKGSDIVDTHFAGKPYKEHIKELVKTTVVRGGDFDQKAITLLDVLEQRGKSKEACAALKKSVGELTRDRVENWRRYLYTLLRNFDKEAYESMKSEQGNERRKTMDEKQLAKEKEKEKRKDAKGKKDAAPESADKAEGDKADGKPAALSEAAAEFVPGKPSWTGGKSDKGFSAAASEFVPGQAWSGGSQRPGKGASFTTNAPEFVPGQANWGDQAAAAAQAYHAWAAGTAMQIAQQQHAAALARVAGSGFTASAAPFVPGQQWPQAGDAKGKGRGAAAEGGKRERKGSAAKAAPTPKGQGPGTAPQRPEVAKAKAPDAAPNGAPKAVEQEIKIPEAQKPAVVPSENTDGHRSPTQEKEGPTNLVPLVLVAICAVGAVAAFALSRRRR